MRRALLVILVLATLVLAACAKPAALGDTVKVDYVGRFQNGTIFDTNIVTVARTAGIYDPNRAYTPLVVTIGEGKVVPGFENALVGMKEGETKTVTVPPDQAYGNRSAGKVLSTSRVMELPRSTSVPIANLPASVRHVGAKVKIKGTFWPSTVVNVSDTEAVLRQDPAANATVSTPFGPANVTVNATNLTLTLIAQPGDTIRNQAGTSRVIGVNTTDLVIDYNHPLAGKTLVFEITMLGKQ